MIYLACVKISFQVLLLAFASDCDINLLFQFCIYLLYFQIPRFQGHVQSAYRKIPSIRSDTQEKQRSRVWLDRCQLVLTIPHIVRVKSCLSRLKDIGIYFTTENCHGLFFSWYQMAARFMTSGIMI